MLRSSGSGCCCPTRQTSAFQRRHQTQSRCQRRERRNKRSTPNGLSMTFPGKVTNLAQALFGPSSIRTILSRIAHRSRLISPRRIKSGTISERHQRKQRHNIPRIHQNLSITPKPISWTRSRSLSLRFHYRRSPGGRTRQLMHPLPLGLEYRWLRALGDPNKPNHMPTSHGSPPYRALAPLIHLKPLCQRLRRRRLSSLNFKLNFINN